MRKSLLCILFFLISIACFGQMEIPARANDRPELVISHTGFTISYNVQTCTANWSAWMLTRERLQPTSRSTSFSSDPEVPAAFRIKPSDYTNTGYDRGHLCPAADMSWNQIALSDCFLMSNICPQTPQLNRGSWRMLESNCRKWAAAEDTLYIISGPVYLSAQKQLIAGKVVIPDGYFKVILSLRPGHQKSIGFYFSNTAVKQDVVKASTTVDQIESLTGLDFFPDLPDEIEKRLESQCDYFKWR